MQLNDQIVGRPWTKTWAQNDDAQRRGGNKAE